MGVLVVLVLVLLVLVVTGGKQSQLLALGLGLGWSLTKNLGVNFFSRGVKKIGGEGEFESKFVFIEIEILSCIRVWQKLLCYYVLILKTAGDNSYIYSLLVSAQISIYP